MVETESYWKLFAGFIFKDRKANYWTNEYENAKIEEKEEE